MADTVELLTTPGDGSWVCPTGVTSVVAECWGGGGLGAYMSSDGGGGGGGGGGYAKKTFVVVPTTSYSYSIAAAKVDPQDWSNPAAAGNPTWFKSNNSAGCVGAAGFGGRINPYTGGNGGSANEGDVVYTGGKGGTGVSPEPWYSGGGGGAAGPLGNGGAASATSAGAGNGDYSGSGGAGLAYDSRPDAGGNPGGNYGGGGGGAARDYAPVKLGGTGAQGLIRLTYTPPITGPSIKMSGITPSKVEGILWANVKDVK